MSESPIDDEEHYARVIVRRGDTRPVRERILALLEPGQDTRNLRTPKSLQHGDRGFKQRYSPLGAHVHVRPGSADEIVLYWSTLRLLGRVQLRPLASPEGAVHPGLVAELLYAIDKVDDFEHVLAQSPDAYEYLMGLEPSYRGIGIEDMQSFAMASRTKQAALDVLREINTNADQA